MLEQFMRFTKQNIWMISILAIILIVFNVWTLNLGIVSSHDWYFKYSETARSIFLHWPYLLNPDAYGSQNLTISNYPILLLWGVLSHIMSFQVIERLLYLAPALVIGTIGSFKLVESITNSQKGAFIGTLIYMLNSYMIVVGYAGHFTILGAYALTPLVLYFIERLIKQPTTSYAIAAALALGVLGIYEFRIMYIVCLLIGLRVVYYILTNKAERSQKIKTLLLSFIPPILVFLLNLPWLVGLYSTNSLTNNVLFSQSLFGNQYLNILYAFSLNHPFWKGDEVVYFQNQTIHFTSLLLPLFAFVSLFKSQNKNNKLQMLFWGIVAIIGIMLVKQVDMPFGGMYEWLFKNFPGFSAFREASKFYVLIALGYSILIGNLVSQRLIVGKYRLENIIFALIAASILITNAYPVFARKLDSNYQSTGIPQEYSEMKEFIETKQGSFNTLWIPYQSNWTYFTKEKPAVNFSNYFYDFVYTKHPKLPNYGDLFLPENKKFLTYILENTGVRYVVLINEPERYTEIGLNYELVLQAFDGNNRFKKYEIAVPDGRQDGGKIIVYELETAKPKLYTASNSYAIQSIGDLDKLMEFNKSVKNSNYISTVNNPESQVTDLGKLLSEVSLIGSRFITKDQLGEGRVKVYKRADIQALNSLYSEGRLALFTSPIGYMYRNGNEIFNETQNQVLFEIVLAEGTYFVQREKDYYLLAPGNMSLGIVGELNYPKEIKIIKFDSQNIFEPGRRYLETDLKNINKTEVYSYAFTNPTKQYVSADVSMDDLEFNFNPTDFENILDNGSFENGLWQENVSDCNNYDEKPILGMELSDDSIHAVQSISLQAQRHTACTSKTIQLKESGHYLFSFWYKSPNASEAGFYLSYGDEFVQRKVQIKNREWNNYYEHIYVPSGVSEVNLTIYSYSTNEKENIVTLYDDFRLYNISTIKELYYVEKTEFEETALPEIDVFEFKPTKYEFRVSNLDNSFYLNFINTYSDEWKLKITEKGRWFQKNEYTVAQGNHLSSTLGFNIWKINVDNLCKEVNCADVDNLSFSLEYRPQKIVNSFYITVGSIIAVVMALLIYLQRRRKTNENNK